MKQSAKKKEETKHLETDISGRDVLCAWLLCMVLLLGMLALGVLYDAVEAPDTTAAGAADPGGPKSLSAVRIESGEESSRFER